MRKNLMMVPCFILAGALLNTSCIGSFGLLNKVSSWNQNATGNKYLNGFIGILLTPVYGFCFSIDWFILNTIEFWTGEQLIAANETRRMVGSDGNIYLVASDKNGYTITNETSNDSVRLAFDADTKTWNLDDNGSVRQLVKVNDDKTLTVYTPDGQELTVTNDSKGMEQLQAALPIAPVQAK